MTSDSVSQIVNFLQISERWGTGGQPTPGQIKHLGPAGYRVVVNLAMPESPEALTGEDALVTSQGLTYIHLPVPWEAPTVAHLKQFFGLMDLYHEDKVFVHCIRNMRVAVFMFLYRVCHLNGAMEEARSDMLRIWHPHGAWQRLIQTMIGEDVFWL